MELRIMSIDCFVEIFHLCIFINGISLIFVNILGNSSAVRIFDAFPQILEQLFVNFIVGRFIFFVPPFNPTRKYSATPKIGNAKIKIIHGTFIVAVWF